MAPLKSTFPLKSFKRTFILGIISCLIFPFLLSAQNIPTPFKKDVDSLIAASPKTYREIDNVLRQYRKDSVLLHYVNNISKSNNYLYGQAYAYNQLGRIYRDISLYPKALEYFQEALKISIEAESIEFRVYSLNMISVVHRRTDAVKSALDYSQEALELAETVAEPSIGLKRSINVSLNSIGNIYQMLEQYELAIEKFERSMILEQELDNKLGLAINHQNLGECYEAQAKLEPALQHFRKSLVYNEIIDSEKGKVICNYSIAHVYVHLSRITEAIDLLEKNLQRAIRLGDKQIVATIYINLGWAFIRKGDYDAAQVNLEKGLDLGKAYNLDSEIAEANKFLSELWIKRDDYEKGMEYFKEFKNYEDRIANSLNLRYVNDMILRYESQIRENQYERLAAENENVRLKLRKNRTMLIIIGIFLILLIGILYILYRQSQLNAEKKLLTLEQSMLRSQMNPHFLFNSLNSIKLYIINNEKKNAVHYLNKFSKLVRKILEASSQREITLAEELETVELYMNIENIRFSNEINFKVHVKDDIDTHNIKIPSLILQPFLENALWHGLSSKDGAKNIDLEIKKGKNGFIEIIISDNGVGRDAAEKIKNSKVLKRKSVGIDITKERLANFSRDYENYFHVEIIDKYNEDNIPTGTQIIIYIPTI
ncbi:Tetratricopeptide repeat-containing protein [Maribacter sedimenticola]|uniref:Tetratricopeptide repeat-containing protein n=1 Tax=Maribacter sedimenticola TaxID=228956 RepID=A0ABY1SCE3_9FLAO|nr:tetratricopeptide repeat protein [Maribacter sedimenticola]SNR25921.1 Tetratricopeptide repeat-containing protein [Maribacter sedimenticola]